MNAREVGDLYFFTTTNVSRCQAFPVLHHWFLHPLQPHVIKMMKSNAAELLSWHNWIDFNIGHYRHTGKNYDKQDKTQKGAKEICLKIYIFSFLQTANWACFSFPMLQLLHALSLSSYSSIPQEKQIFSFAWAGTTHKPVAFHASCLFVRPSFSIFRVFSVIFTKL